MAAVKTSLSALVASLFGNSEKTISEKLSSEEFNQFATDAQGAAQRISELENEKTTAEASITALTTRATTAEGLVTARDGQITELEGKLKAAETERDQYKGWFNDEKAKGKGLPAEDASNKAEEGSEGLTDYNADALAYFRRTRGGASN